MAKKKTSKTLESVKIRNPHAWSPLLKKGGSHGKSKSALRSQAKRSTQKEVRENSPPYFFPNFIFCLPKQNIMSLASLV